MIEQRWNNKKLNRVFPLLALSIFFGYKCSGGSRISPRRGRQLSGGRQDTILLKFPENCMKLKKIQPPGGGASPVPPPPRSATANVILNTLPENMILRVTWHFEHKIWFPRMRPGRVRPRDLMPNERNKRTNQSVLCRIPTIFSQHHEGTSNISDILREYQTFLNGFYNGSLWENIFLSNELQSHSIDSRNYPSSKS